MLVLVFVPGPLENVNGAHGLEFPLEPSLVRFLSVCGNDGYM